MQFYILSPARDICGENLWECYAMRGYKLVATVLVDASPYILKASDNGSDIMYFSLLVTQNAMLRVGRS